MTIGSVSINGIPVGFVGVLTATCQCDF